MKKGRIRLYPLFLAVVIMAAAFWCPEMEAKALTQEECTALLSAIEASGHQLIIVAKNGCGDYTTISEAVLAAADGDTILIYPGVYEERVYAWEKEVYLVGWDRETCIIRCSADDYVNSPLLVAAGGVSNLTIEAFRVNHENKAEGMDLGGSVISNPEIVTGYAVHVESDYTYGRSLTIQNCHIVSEASYCIGIGSRGESSIRILDCELESYGTGGCLFFHDSTVGGTLGHSTFLMANCDCKNYRSPYAFAFHSYFPQNETDVTFIGNRIYSVGYENRSLYAETNFLNSFSTEEWEKAGGMVRNLNLSETEIYYTQRYEGNPVLREGITVCRMDQGEIDELRKRGGDFSGRIRSVFLAYNGSLMQGTGWLGLDNYHLMPESAGNTLMEMNYSFGGLIYQ